MTTIERINRTPFGKVLIDVSTATSLDEVLTTAGLDFTVEKHSIQTSPIITDDGVTTLDFTSDKGIVFNRDGALTAGRTVGAKYQIVQNHEAFGPLQYLKDEGFITSFEQAGHLDGGGKCFVIARLASESQLADPHHRMLLLTTSHDGTIAVTARGWQQRLFCANQIPSITKNGKSAIVRISHSRNAMAAVAAMRGALLDALRVMDEYDEAYERLTQHTVYESHRHAFVKQLFPLRPDVTDFDVRGVHLTRFDRGQRIAIKRTLDKRSSVLTLMGSPTVENISGTAAAMYQAAVEWSDYGTGSKNAAARILKGTDVKFKARAFELASAYAN